MTQASSHESVRPIRQPSAEFPLTFRNTEPYSPAGLPPDGAPDWIWEVDHPYLHGLFAPVDTEVSADDLVVEQGEIPQDLYGMSKQQCARCSCPCTGIVPPCCAALSASHKPWENKF